MPSTALLRLFITCGLSLVALPMWSQSATVEVPAEVTIGSEIQVSWTGPNAKGDFLSLDPPGAADRKYGSYVYLRHNPAVLRAPGTPGTWTVRYHSGASGFAVLATATLKVVATTAKLSVPATVEMGQATEVTWTGPDHQGDFISIDPVGAADKGYGPYAYTKEGSPLSIVAPTEPGQYEVRYHLGISGYVVIGSAKIEVGSVSAKLVFPAQVDAGGKLSVTWQGPGNAQDFISIDEAGAAESVYGKYSYAARGNPPSLVNPVEIQIPDQPGSYEVRYHLGTGKYPVIGSAPLEVGGVTATVSVSGPVIADEPFEVEWTGPNNHTDYITIVPAGTPDGKFGPYAYTRRGNPLRVKASKETGAHEVRYLTGQSNSTLASVAVEVIPGQAKGSLKVFLGDASSENDSATGAVEVILDASGSMLQRLDGTRRIELARQALLDLTSEVLPAGVPFALRIFGHKEADSCRTDLEIPMAPLDRARAAGVVKSVNAKNLAKTPIADSLRHVGKDLAGASGPRLVILITDGEETCDGDPAQVIRDLKASGIDVRVNIVGFAIDELMVKEAFERWAQLGGGRYFDAADGESLKGAVKGALARTFEVYAGSEVVATGSVGGDGVELAPGQYKVRFGDREIHSVTIQAKEETRLRVDG